MTDLIFYTNPMSRGQMVRWMLEEVGAPYETVLLDYATTMKQEPYLSINPMGKVPAIQHRGKVVTEVAAICAYLADAFPEAGLAPPNDDRGDYYRFLFYAAGPIEQSFSNRAAGFVPKPEQSRMFGYGSWDNVLRALDHMLAGRDYVTGTFSAADVYFGAMLEFMITFKMLEASPTVAAYVARMTDREAFRRAKQRDAEAAESMKAKANG